MTKLSSLSLQNTSFFLLQLSLKVTEERFTSYGWSSFPASLLKINIFSEWVRILKNDFVSRSIRELPHSVASAAHVFPHCLCCDHTSCRPAWSGIKTIERTSKVPALASQSFKEVSRNASQCSIINISGKSAGRESLKLNTAAETAAAHRPEFSVSNLIHFSCQDPLQRGLRWVLSIWSSNRYYFRLRPKQTAAAARLALKVKEAVSLRH